MAHPPVIFSDKVLLFILNIFSGAPNRALLCTTCTLIVSSSGVGFCTMRIGLVFVNFFVVYLPGLGFTMGFGVCLHSLYFFPQ